MNRELKYALGKTIPIMFSYLFLSMAFGIMMNQAGFPLLGLSGQSHGLYRCVSVCHRIVPFCGGGHCHDCVYGAGHELPPYVLWSHVLKRVQKYGKVLSVHDLFPDG